MSAGSLTLGTRGSALAVTQARLIQTQLEEAGRSVELREISTTGDRILDVPLSDIGDKALFTKELDLALLDGSIHLAVHSLKDLPTEIPPGLRIAAVPERENPRDAFVAHPTYAGELSDLPRGARLATSSLRRRAQVLARRPDLEVVPVRGNVDTRLAKLDASDWHGLLLARAGLVRLGLTERIRQTIETDCMLPAVGQGALAVVCAEEDTATFALLRQTIHHQNTWAAVAAERAFLRRLEGGCSVPVGAFGRVDGGSLQLDGCVASLDGNRLLRGERSGSPADAERLGLELASELVEQGADDILAEIREAES